MPLSLAEWPPVFSHSKSFFFSLSKVNQQEAVYVTVQGLGSATRFPGSGSWIWSWANCSRSMSLSTFLCKMGMLPSLTLPSTLNRPGIYSKCSKNVKSCYCFVFQMSLLKVMTSLYLDLKEKKEHMMNIVNNALAYLPLQVKTTSWRLINFLILIN